MKLVRGTYFVNQVLDNMLSATSLKVTTWIGDRTVKSLYFNQTRAIQKWRTENVTYTSF